MKIISLDMFKKILFTLIIIFNLQSLTQADDIKDFEIEGMSIGDSLLDYYNINQIKSFLQTKQYPGSQRIKMYLIEDKKFSTYEYVAIDALDDNNYEILKIAGQILFRNNIKDCYKKMDQISSLQINIDSQEKKNIELIKVVNQK